MTDTKRHKIQIEREPVIAWFSNLMEQKLLMNGGKAHWRTMSLGALQSMAMAEVGEYLESLDMLEHRRTETTLENEKAMRQNVADECADVANFFMFIADKIVEPSTGQGWGK